MTSILMVCLGNICRSPLAEGILSSKIDASVVSVDSAGTGAYHVGNLPDARSIEVAQKHGLDITNQRARAFQQNDFDRFDKIYVMDLSNYKNVLNLARNASDKAKVSLILSEIDTSSQKEVPDPYYGGDAGFENVYQLLDEACEIIAKKING